MDLYRLDIQIMSPSGTPWQSDTLFGHLCWQIAFTRGDKELGDFLSLCKSGHPPFVLSDGFPVGLLPRPRLPWLSKGTVHTIDDYALIKKRKKAPYLTLEQFKQVSHGEPFAGEPPFFGWVPVETPHASLDRRSLSTGGDDSAGQFFQSEGFFPISLEDDPSVAGNTLAAAETPPAGAGVNMNIYARASKDGLVLLEELMRGLEKTGYGKDKSVGRGQFRFLTISPVPEFDNIPRADGFVSLSSFVPAADDPVDGYWKIRVKTGRLGEHFVFSELPFKRPLIQLEPGAVFRTEHSKLKPWYGRVVEHVAPAKPEVVQNCQTVALPLLFDKR